MEKNIMKNKIKIRYAEKKDIEPITNFNIAMAKETENKVLDPEIIKYGVQNLFTHPTEGFYVVAEYNEKVIASLMITTEWSDWRNGIFWWVQSVYVIPEFRRKGVYSKLYTFVKENAEQNDNICGLRLYVEQNNLTAQKTYGKLGMQETHYKLFEETF